MNVIKLDEEAIYHVARSIGAPEARESYLQQVCGVDPALRDRIGALLRVCEQEPSFLEVSPYDAAPGVPAQIEGPGTTIGPYKLMELIGEGGMGVIYVAEQREPVRRKVALKVIKPGMDTKQVIARFEAERQALAMMDHPNIAKVFDAGATESGRSYFVMELVRGVPITEYCDGERLSIRERLKLFVLVCRAVQHAHLKGIIHRDLKPTNILVTLHDPGAPGVPKVIDFGVAKATGPSLTEKTIYTAFTQLVGTPLYMSPEQVELSGLDIDTRSDIYSLGVLLYELLTGTTPFDSEVLRLAAFDEMRRIIREEEPLTPSMRLNTLGETLTTTSLKRSSDPRHLNRSVRGELDWIVMKALEKDRGRRYETANDFAADINRYLIDRPVEACSPTAWYRLTKTARRNRVALTTAALVVAALLIGTVASTWQAVRATRAEVQADRLRAFAEWSADEAERRATEARTSQTDAIRAQQEAERQRNAVSQNLYYADVRLGLVDWNAGNVARLSGKLLNHVPLAGGHDLRGWEWYFLLSLCHQDQRTLMHHSGRVNSVAWSPDGRFLASTGHEGTVNVYDSTAWRVVRTTSGASACGARWSPDSQRLAWGTEIPDSGVYVLEVETGEVKVLRGHTASVWTLAWSPDGKYLASAGRDRRGRIWEPATGSCIHVMEAARSYTTWLAWHPNGQMLASFDAGDGLVIRNAVSWAVLRADPSARGVTKGGSWNCIAWSPDGKQLAMGTITGICQLYNTADWSLASQWQGHTGSVNLVAWNSEGSRLASAGGDRLIQFWDPVTGRCLLTLRGHLKQVEAVAWEPNGRRLASGGTDGLVKVWPLPPASQPRRLEGHPGGVQAIAWSEEGNTLRSLGTADGTSALWDVTGGRCPVKVPVVPGRYGQFSTGARLLAIATADDKQPAIVLYNTRSGELVQTLSAGKDAAALVAFSRDASKLALANGSGGSLEIVDLRQNEVDVRWQTARFNALSWSPDGRLLAAAGRGEPSDGDLQYAGWVYVFDIQNRRRVMKVQHGTSNVAATSVTWSPNGQRLASGDVEGLVEIREVSTGTRVVSVHLHTAVINALAWSPDGRRIASGSGDGTVRVWDSLSGEELLKLEVPQAYVARLEWSRDGRRLAAATADGAIHIWDATAGYEFAHSEAFFLGAR